MVNFNKKYVPITFLVLISLSWGYYYQSINWFNGFGKFHFEWLFLIDGLIVLPILCFLCFKSAKEAILKSVVYACLAIVVGSFIIPEKNKVVWEYLEVSRYVVLAGFVLFEMVIFLSIFFVIKVLLTKNRDPDTVILKSIESFMGKGGIAKLLSFEARVWVYALFSRRVKKRFFTGVQHFSYHQKDGTQSNLLGFILLILIELPIVHLLLHFLWSPLAANITTGLTLLGLVFFIAEYKAVAIRPISLDKDKLIIRYGLYNPLEIPFEAIEFINQNTKRVFRKNNIKRFNYAGNPNVVIGIRNADYQKVYLGLDDPQKFIDSVTNQIGYR